MWGADDVAALLRHEADLRQHRWRWAPTRRELVGFVAAVAVAVPLGAVLHPARPAPPAPPLPAVIEMVDPFSQQPVRCSLTPSPVPRYVCVVQENR